MPETSVNEDNDAVFWKNNVGMAGKRPIERAVDGEAIAHAMEQGADNEFWFCIL